MVDASPSVLPPRTLAKIKRLPTEERRIYVQELIGKYEHSALQIPRAAKDLAESWAEPQRVALENCLEELRQYLED